MRTLLSKYALKEMGKSHYWRSIDVRLPELRKNQLRSQQPVAKKGNGTPRKTGETSLTKAKVFKTNPKEEGSMRKNNFITFLIVIAVVITEVALWGLKLIKRELRWRWRLTFK